MKFGNTARQLADTSHISRYSARVLHDFLLAEQPVDCLELGFAHGANSGCIAAALDKLDRGHLTCVDTEPSLDFTPVIEQSLERLSLFRPRFGAPWRQLLQLVFGKTAESRTRDDVGISCCYDVVFIDDSKNWATDGMAFFMADKLLRPGGWIVFDNHDRRYADALASGKDNSDSVSARARSKDQIEQPNVAAIFHLLVAQHPGYANFTIQDHSWTRAQKTRGRRDIRYARKSTLKSRFKRWASPLRNKPAIRGS